jgi:hypothetical protein
MHLHEIPAAYRALDDLLNETGGEVTPEVEKFQASIEGTLSEKVDCYGSMEAEAEGEISALKLEETRLSDMRQAVIRRRDAHRKAIFDALKAAGEGSVKGARYRARLAKSSVPSIRWAGDSPIPRAFARVKVELDGKKAKEAHDAGNLPNGFTVTFSEHVVIA